MRRLLHDHDIDVRSLRAERLKKSLLEAFTAGLAGTLLITSLWAHCDQQRRQRDGVEVRR